jgi:hypothetical protein
MISLNGVEPNACVIDKKAGRSHLNGNEEIG